VSVLAAVCVALASGAIAVVVWRRLSGRGAGSDGLHPTEPPPITRDQWLRQAGVTMSAFQLRIAVAAGTFGTFTLLTLATRTPLVAVPPAIAIGVAPFVYLGHRRNLRLRAWQAAWPDALRELVAAIVAGRSLTQGINALGTTGPDPLREVFADFPAIARIFGTASGLEQIKERMADPTTDRVIEVLLVAHERGGAIVRDVLEDLILATTKDIKVLEEIDTEGLEMRINARAVLVLPWFVLVALTMRPGPFREFYRSTAGLLVVCAAGLLSAFGAWWLGRLGREPDEPRVFARRFVGPDLGPGGTG
jgi:tight adherence protein B